MNTITFHIPGLYVHICVHRNPRNNLTPGVKMSEKQSVIENPRYIVFLCCSTEADTQVRYDYKLEQEPLDEGERNEEIRTVRHTFVLDLQVLIGSRARVRKDVRSSHHRTLSPVIASERQQEGHNE